MQEDGKLVIKLKPGEFLGKQGQIIKPVRGFDMEAHEKFLEEDRERRLKVLFQK